MAVQVGSARINENGELEGGKLGDQTGKEVMIENWYLHAKGWYVIRAIDASARAKIAQNMRYICENDNIGYSYWNNAYGLTNEAKKYKYDASKVKVKVDTNCAKSARLCILYAGIEVDDFSTADELEACERTGKFIILKDDKYTKTSDYLLEGDILVTRTKAHTVVVMSNGSKAIAYTPYRIGNCAACNLRKGDSKDTESLGILHPGDKVELYGRGKNNWGRVRYKNTYGYVSPLYLIEYDKAKTSGKVWLREGVGTSKAGIVAIPSNTTVYITGNVKKNGNTPWYEVIFAGLKGWSSGAYVKTMK